MYYIHIYVSPFRSTYSMICSKPINGIDLRIESGLIRYLKNDAATYREQEKKGE